jgi:hypothetical protein
MPESTSPDAPLGMSGCFSLSGSSGMPLFTRSCSTLLLSSPSAPFMHVVTPLGFSDRRERPNDSAESRMTCRC